MILPAGGGRFGLTIMIRKKARIDTDKIARLVPLCLRRDPEAWDKLIRAVSPVIYSAVCNKFRRMGVKGRKGDIENITQDILIKIWEKNKLADVKDVAKIVPWLCVFSNYSASNFIRDKAHELFGRDDLEDNHESPEPGPMSFAVSKETGCQIEEALAALKPKERTIIKLLYVYGKKYKEIAATMNMPIGTVLAYSDRARTKLRKFLKKLQ